jgi:NADH-quinone oxidoreductase subunit N
VQNGFYGFAFQTSQNALRNYGMVTIDPFGFYFKGMILLTSVIVVLFSVSSDEIKKITERTGEYYALIFGMILGMFFMISASDLILVYLSME